MREPGEPARVMVGSRGRVRGGRRASGASGGKLKATDWAVSWASLGAGEVERRGEPPCQASSGPFQRVSRPYKEALTSPFR